MKVCHEHVIEQIRVTSSETHNPIVDAFTYILSCKYAYGFVMQGQCNEIQQPILQCKCALVSGGFPARPSACCTYVYV